MTLLNISTKKMILVLVAVIFSASATVLIFMSGEAATITGNSPFASIKLVHGVNTGILKPSEERWFRLTPGQPGQTNNIEQALTLVVTPARLMDTGLIKMQIFEENQVLQFYQNLSSQMHNLGAGQQVDRDGNPETGEFLWSGWLTGESAYYVQVTNSNTIPIDYWLFTDNVSSYELGQPSIAPAVPAVVESAEVEIEVAAPPAEPVNPADNGPDTAHPLQFDRNKGGLEPGEQVWFSVTMNDSNGAHYESLALTLVVTPDNNGGRAGQIVMDIFPPEGVAGQNMMGRGSVITRDNDPFTGEQIWAGTVMDGARHYIRLTNGADIHMDYWLFTGDVQNPNLGE
jgi:hypothetical protein